MHNEEERGRDVHNEEERGRDVHNVDVEERGECAQL